ncbi:DNA-methyltransferase [Helicobacter winghamensis]|uniref:Methyltransferase n=1 Tax=Helicobacter winghamensis TaxID=157268 RepID=A0A2N3PHR6_9HELI|nr:site-specific DNA-methyltransferase [Helicobacter winghamensis]EEO25549.1 DNA (cytosine-5-)-methyltransferase [Helicobacter winghamensis ATCC BAA-430]PKT78033.1 DNA methyltransferase [Helicobacter winghamensis]PKT78298.1 DNA methyltransferase [Helicobacter winghamensis]PKT78561.1 DNA methyltransferase [Helicobacter winghamensis]PKT80110.1 DNA methyltransferase [Helicobacter winghamensis]
MKLYNADSYTFIQQMLENKVKVHHIITDPPYNISKSNNFPSMRQRRQGVDFGVWDKGFDLVSWIPQYAEILDKNGSMIIFCSYRFISFITQALENSNMIVKDVLIWQKSNPMPRNTTRRYVQDLEFAVWAVKSGAKWVFNKPSDVPYLRSIFTHALVSGKEKLGHPTQKSLKLMKDLIQIHTNLNEVVLDPFMGSGSTGAACLELGREFIGIERDKKFFTMAQKRLESYNKD